MSNFIRISVVLSLLAGLAVAVGGSSVAATAAASEADTTPPDAYIRARARQDMDRALDRGIGATCGTADDERPLTCRMSITRQGAVLASETCHFDRPFNRCHFDLRPDGDDRRRIREAGHSVGVRLHLRATDESGNTAVVTRSVRIVEGLWG